MPACATQETIADPASMRNLILPVPDTDFREFLGEVDELARFAPEIITADSIKLVPAIGASIKRTGVVAELVSTDDGYASANGREEVLAMGVKAISISGAKGKKLTTLEDWESEAYREARSCRSAVESLMFTIKDGFAFGELGRRGIDALREDLRWCSECGGSGVCREMEFRAGISFLQPG